MTDENLGNQKPFLDEKDIDSQLKKRPLSATLLNLKWLAEKFRRKENLKHKIASGAYSVKSDQIAKVMLNKD
jgi:anti-sigma28 factor (negative regulator of flagellin synthesis)